MVSCEGRGPESSSSPAEAPVFREAAEDTGLRFRHFIGATGEYYLPEIMGAGVAVFDYDGDGDLDVYLLQGTLLDTEKELEDSVFAPFTKHRPGNRLFRNELVPQGELRFSDVTAYAGVGHEGYGMGVAVGDYDADGHLDLYVTNFGPNVFYRNNGDATFTNVTDQITPEDDRWSTSAAFADYDSDGDLDLFYTNYVDFSLAQNRVCREPAGARDYCNPSAYPPVADRLLRNDGRRFTDVTPPAGIGQAFSRGLGVTFADFNGDGLTDIFVANDGDPNQLWINQGEGRFLDQALVSGAALNADGRAEAGMGVTAADFDGDGDQDLFLTHLARETNTLYLNDGQGNFKDATGRSGLAMISFPFTGFGTAWFDYDSDGFLDLFIANGAVTMIESQRGSAYPFRQTNQLFRDEAERRFRDMSGEAGDAFMHSEVSRGAALGDVDNDGDIDIVVNNNNGPVRLLLNETPTENSWLQLRLHSDGGNHEAIGAEVRVIRPGEPPLIRVVRRDGGYLSSSNARVHFGLGEFNARQVVVRWPSGQEEMFVVENKRSVILVRGQGSPPE